MRSKSFIKTAIILFNLLLFIVGCGVLCLGIFILVSDFGAKELSTLLGSELYHDTAYLAIAGGAAIAIISLCGCCGSFKESKCILGVYLSLMVLIFLVLLSAAVLVFVFLGQISKDAKESMATALTERYGVDLDSHAENRMLTDMWNFMQTQLECCGVSGDINSTTSWAIYKTQSKWYQQHTNDEPYVPESCCKSGEDVSLCVGLTSLDGPPKVNPPFNTSHAKNPALHTSGCYDELVHYIQAHTLIIGGAAIGAVVIMLFGIISGFCLCRRIKYQDYLTS